MDLPDCPPGAEGYQDSVTEVPKKPEDSSCTKAEQEFQEHLNSLKIKVEDGSYHCMVERRGRDISGKWIYLCYPCAAVCSGEAILQTHLSGKKHKAKLSIKPIWPMSIFSEHPYNQSENSNKATVTKKVLKKMAEEVEQYNKSPSEMDLKYGKLKNVRCHIQDSLDEIVTPLVGVEYLIEHPPAESHHEPSYTCTLCVKQGHPRTIVNHMTCFWHRHKYLQRHFPRATELLQPFRQQTQYRDGVAFVLNRIAQRIVEKYGRMKPINIEKEDYDKDKDRIHQWIYQGHHFSETKDCTFEEVVDVDLIKSLDKSKEHGKSSKDPSPPRVAVPKPHNYSNRAGGRRERRVSMESVSDISDDQDTQKTSFDDRFRRAVHPLASKSSRYEPYPDANRAESAAKGNKYAIRKAAVKAAKIAKAVDPSVKMPRPPNYEYKVTMARDKCRALEEAARKSLAYHEKNPEKHPLYPEEWKKFWNHRYKEIQAEGKDPSKHDFKPEWIVFWTGRMKELHKEELRMQVVEYYRKLCLTPPRTSPGGDAPRGKSPAPKDARRRSPDTKKRSPYRAYRPPLDDRRRRSPHFRRDRRSPVYTPRWSPPRRHSPVRMRSRSPVHRLRSPARTNIVLESRGSRSPLSRRDTLHRNRSPLPIKQRSPPPHGRSPVPRARSPMARGLSPRLRSRSPGLRSRSPGPRSHSPRLRGSIPSNRSPDFHRVEAPRNSSLSRNRSPAPSASLHTVLISDDELKPDDGMSGWNSDNEVDSLGSLPDARSPPRSHSGSAASRRTHAPDPRPFDRDVAADNVVATLRTLVALEDYLGSLGPKVVDLLAEAIKMEKDKANSSEELLEREPAVVLIETAKEKLKGAAQAGLVAPAAAAAVRAAIVRAAATLHEADKRTRSRKVESGKKAKAKPVAVAGVGTVDRAQIAQQLAEALVAQGKTDVSSEELAQLVDAVVGMAEAKEREADAKRQVGAAESARPAPACGTATALQMLQSAYDDKKCEKDDAPNAMDGLSDSDLETLLKNFNELSAEEQHSLIAYLKKLEAREPQRVERLRQYVSAAACNAPVAPAPAAPLVAPPAPAPAHKQQTEPVPIESDEDDYTVEEVFKSVTEKVKEDKIRQEMEIVKKSLEESKVTAVETVAASTHTPAPSANIDLPSVSSAAGLLALVQASLQSTSKPILSTSAPQGANVVTSNTQPKAFGDLPETSNPIQHINPASNFTSNQFNDRGMSQPQTIASLVNNSTTRNQPRFGGNKPNMQNETHFGGNNPSMQNEARFAGNNPSMQNEPRFSGNNPSMQNEPRFGGNNANMQNEPRFAGNNPSMQNEPRFAGNNPSMQNEPRFAGNNPSMQNEPRFAGNNPSMQNEPRFAGNNPSMQNEPRYGGNNIHTQNEPRYGGNSMSMQDDQRFGGNNLNTQNEPRFAGNLANMHNDQGFGGNNPNPHNVQRLGGNNPNMQSDNTYGGNNPNMYSEQSYGGSNPNVNSEQSHYNAHSVGPWETSAPPHQNSYQQDAFNQRPQGGSYNNMNAGRMQDNFSQNQQQFGNYDQNNHRGRGGRGNARGFGNRGRGRGRGW